MKKILLILVLFGVFGFIAVKNYQDLQLKNKSDIALNKSLSDSDQDLAKYEKWLTENSNGQQLTETADRCLSFSYPPPPCACPTPNGGCIRVSPGTICYNGTEPICPAN